MNVSMSKSQLSIAHHIISVQFHNFKMEEDNVQDLIYMFNLQDHVNDGNNSVQKTKTLFYQ